MSISGPSIDPQRGASGPDDPVACDTATIGSGRYQSHTSTPAITALTPAANQTRDVAHHKIPAHSAIIPEALHLARRLTLRDARQLRIIGPNTRCSSSQRENPGELRAAAQLAIKINTVVGSPGTKIPTTPSATHSPANPINK